MKYSQGEEDEDLSSSHDEGSSNLGAFSLIAVSHKLQNKEEEEIRQYSHTINAGPTVPFFLLNVQYLIFCLREHSTHSHTLLFPTHVTAPSIKGVKSH